MPPLAEANAAQATARQMRGEWLLLIHEEILTVADLVKEAAKLEGRPLRRLKLRTVLEAQPGWGRKSSDRLIAKVFDTLRLVPAPEVSAVTVGWLIDARTEGTRLLAWLDALHPRQTPWPGFPFTPAPGRSVRKEAAA